MRLIDVVYDTINLSYVDFSGFNRTVSKIGSGNWEVTPPLTSKTYNAIRVTPTSGLLLADIPIGKYSHERESFSINTYFKKIDGGSTTSNILFDETAVFGLIYDNNKLVFKIRDASDYVHVLPYSIPVAGDAYHISATYNDRVMSLVIDGETEASLVLPDTFKFKSTVDLDLKSSITSGIQLIDKVQILNEVLAPQKLQLELRQDKYLQAPAQVIIKDNPHYFGFERNLKKIDDIFEYGLNKDYSTATLTDLEIDQYGYLVVSSEATSGTLEDYHYFPPLVQSTHNQIDWYGDTDNITLEYSLDGLTYTNLNNHKNIDGFTGGYFYYRVTITKNDIHDNPRFYSLRFTSYVDRKFPSDNSLYEIDTVNDYTVGSMPGLLIDHSDTMGITMMNGGFTVSDTDIRSVEFLYRPTTLTAQNTLVEAGVAKYGWSAAGAITKSGIENLYINGKNLNGETSVSTVFTPNMWHHVAISFLADQPGPVAINQSIDGSVLGAESGFAHLAIYDHDIPDDAVRHYKYLTTKVSEPAISDSINLGSESFDGYSVDKVIVSTQ